MGAMRCLPRVVPLMGPVTGPLASLLLVAGLLATAPPVAQPPLSVGARPRGVVSVRKSTGAPTWGPEANAPQPQAAPTRNTTDAEENLSDASDADDWIAGL